MVDCKTGNTEKCREAEPEYQDECIWLETERYKGIGVSDMFKCPWCGKHFNSHDYFLRHMRGCKERDILLYGENKQRNTEKWNGSVGD
jgi:uncharacterized C2H2 Zn-finger protein